MAEQALSFEAVENLWLQAGGNPQAAAMAAAIADASSGLNPDAMATTTGDDSGVQTRGLWQIPSTLAALSTTDPLANARAAVQLSSNGTDWSQWPVAWSNNDGTGTLLGTGSNAVAALQGRGGTYAVIGGNGSVPSTSAGTDDTSGDSSGDAAGGDSATTPAASKSSNHRVLFIALALIILAAAFYYNKMKGSGTPIPDTGVGG